MKTTDQPIGTRKDEPKMQGKTNNQQKGSVTPVNNNDESGTSPGKDSSNKGKGPKGENL
ncbi:hypothetical protein [Mucilaginibacter boryungensis]|uniref:Uncharacterized protein n=1 Tax=Mucilaginibacter boryungensis TaxID=768480 RepID=A0ABR9XJF7_9SPHI|nr:hypothetical protein [Mucilaginibacter boryungensis]MBE9667355.1 hypothetical protein [Mucilaginibacter boryungensis]